MQRYRQELSILLASLGARINHNTGQAYVPIYCKPGLIQTDDDLIMTIVTYKHCSHVLHGMYSYCI